MFNISNTPSITSHSYVYCTFIFFASFIFFSGCKHEKQETHLAPSPFIQLTSKEIESLQIEVSEIKEQNISDTIVTSAKVAFDDTLVTHVFSPVSGRVMKMLAKPGDKVKKGDTLAVIDSPEMGLASSDVGKAKADMIAAERELSRQKEMLSAHASSERDFEQAEDHFRRSKAELERAKQKIRLLRANAYDAVTQTYLLRSEMDGEVIMRNLSLGVEVQGQYSTGSASELFTIGELSRVWIFADIHEQDIARVKLGAAAQAHVVAYPDRSFSGAIEWVSGVLEPTTRTAKVRATFENFDGALKPEMYATFFITVDTKRSLAISRSSIVKLGEQNYVFAQRTPTSPENVNSTHYFEKVVVTVPEMEGETVLPVLHGLSPGDKIVTRGAILLSSIEVGGKRSP